MERTIKPIAAPRETGAIPTIALGTTVLLWATAYIGLAPAVRAPEWLILSVVVIGLLVGGVVAGRVTSHSLRSGVLLGLVIGLINFIIVGSLHGRETTAGAIADGFKWIGGAIVVTTVLSIIGAVIGSRWRRATRTQHEWTSKLALVVGVTTLPLLISGGIVTGLEAGMAVYDWLTTFEFPMMLYPLSLMQNDPGVYAEHFHRLWGLLIGISAILLVVQMIRARERRARIVISVCILVAVIVQGVVGGTRVLGDNIALAIVHGIFAQIVFATIVLLAAMTSPSWRTASQRTASSGSDHTLTAGLVILMIVQIAIGALYRHLNGSDAIPAGLVHGVLTLHIAGAALVAFGVFALGLRGWNEHRGLPAIPRVSMALMITVGVQLLLGVAATITILLRGTSQDIPTSEVIITTAHQATGALLLAGSVLYAGWIRRLFRRPDPNAPGKPATHPG